MVGARRTANSRPLCLNYFFCPSGTAGDGAVWLYAAADLNDFTGWGCCQLHLAPGIDREWLVADVTHERWLLPDP